MSVTSFSLTISSTMPTTDRFDGEIQQPIPTSYGRSFFDNDVPVWPRKALGRTAFVGASARRLRPWTVTQPWTPRTRPPLLGKRPGRVSHTAHRRLPTREQQEERPALARGKGIRQYSSHLPRGRFSNVPQWPHLNVR